MVIVHKRGNQYVLCKQKTKSNKHFRGRTMDFLFRPFWWQYSKGKPKLICALGNYILVPEEFEGKAVYFTAHIYEPQKGEDEE